jgi:hypothetical protein
MNIELGMLVLGLEKSKQRKFFASVKRLIRSRLKGKTVEQVSKEFGIPA